MTEIRIEKKKSVWIWIILGILIVAAIAIIYSAAFINGEENENVLPETTEVVPNKPTDLLAVNENNSTVAAYITFVENDNNKMGLDHEFTNEAILKLIKAIEAIAGEIDYDIRVDMDRVKGLAENITIDPYVNTHADSMKKASEVLTNSLQNIQKAKYPGLANDLAKLRDASNAINPDVLALKQKDKIKGFFRSAADLLKKMN